MSTAHRPVLVVDCGAQYAQLIARRVREANVYSEIVPHSMSAAAMLEKNPAAVILSGGPSSVYEVGAPTIDPALFDSGVPIMGICYGFQAMAAALGGTVAQTGLSEYGRTQVQVADAGAQLAGSPSEQQVWMSHGDAVHAAPEGFTVLASTDGAPVAAFENVERRMSGVQWHPEVKHSPLGQEAIENFLYRIAEIAPDWTSSNVIDEQVERIRAQVGTGRVICGLSGGVDSAVAAAIVQKAVGDQLTCIFVDHGLLRAGEAEQVERDFVATTGIRLVVADERARFLDALAGADGPRDQAQDHRPRVHPRVRGAGAQARVRGRAWAKKSGSLFKERCTRTSWSLAAARAPRRSRATTTSAVCPTTSSSTSSNRYARSSRMRCAPSGSNSACLRKSSGVSRSRVPASEFASSARSTQDRIDILQAADAIARAELTAAGLDRDIWQCPVVLLADVRSVGVQGDGRTYGHPIVLRPVSSEDAMTADWTRVPYEVLERISTRITNEVREVNRVVLDVTSKPPGTIEWE